MKKLLFIIGGIIILILYSAGVVVASIMIYKNSIVITTPTPTPSPSPIAVKNLSVYDTFDNNNNNWSATTDNTSTQLRTTTISDGKYTWEVRSKKSMQSWVLKDFTAAENFTISMDARTVTGPTGADYNIIFNKLDNDNYYKFGVSDSVQKYCLYMYYLGQWQKLIPWTISDTIKNGEVNNLKVVVVGSHITLYINENKVNQIIDDTFSMNTSMGISVELFNADQIGTFEFDNFNYHVDEVVPTAVTL